MIKQSLPAGSAGKIAKDETDAKVEYSTLTDPPASTGILNVTPSILSEINKEERRQAEEVPGSSVNYGGALPLSPVNFRAPLKLPNNEGELPQVIIEDRRPVPIADLLDDDELAERDAANRAELEAGDWPENVVVDDDAGAASDAPKDKAIHAVPNANYFVFPKTNILDQYASYNYNIGWYLLQPHVLRGKSGHTPYDFRKNPLSGYYLLAQSGGVTNTEGSIDISFPGEAPGDPRLVFPDSADKQRNPYFNLDYYIDSLEIVTQFPGGATRLSNTHATIKFTLVEPNGITLTKNLFNALQDVYGSQGTTQKVALSAAHYALVIRFYGYDENGKIVTARNNDTTDSQAVVEKFIPFRLATINFRIANQLTQYVIDGRPIPYSVGGSSSRGTIQSPIQLTGSTVEDILVGKPVGTQYQKVEDGRPTTPAAPAKTPDPNPHPGIGSPSWEPEPGHSPFHYGP